MTKQDIELTEELIPFVASKVLQNVVTCQNKERQSKRSELFLRCGAGYDTESTTVVNAAGKPLFAFVYHIQIMINGYYIYFRDLQLLTPFLKALIAEVKKKRTKKKQPKLLIWIANLGHEYAFFKKQIAEAEITDVFAKNERTPLKIEVGGCIEFRECIGLFGTSLADIAKKNTKTQKLVETGPDGEKISDLDYDLIRTPATPIKKAPDKGHKHSEYEYMRNDVAILDELSEVAFQRFTDKGLKIPLTKTGILRQECKNMISIIRFEEIMNSKLMPITKHDYFMQRKFMYAGGLSGTSPVYAGKFISRSKCADITSDYPAQMNHHLFPAGELRETDVRNISKVGSKFRIIMFVCDLKAKTTHAVFSKHKVINFDGDKYCRGVGSVRNAIVLNGKVWEAKNCCLLLNNTDLKGLKELYEFRNIRLLRLWYFTEKKKAPYFLRKCMNKYYLRKQELKEQGLDDTIEYKLCKEMVNSFYGMSVTRLYDCIFKWNEAEHKIAEAASEKSYDQQREHVWLSPFIGYWTTSYARCILYHYIAKYPELILQYDTDSLYYITEPSEVKLCRNRTCSAADLIAALEADIEDYNQIMYQKNARIFKGNKHFKTLGSWEVEPENTGFKGLGAKRYLVRKANGKLKPVVAGMVKSSFLTYIKKTGKDPFEVFDQDMQIDRVISEKLASMYCDNEELRPVKVRDYLGKETIVQVGTYHALYSISFDIKTARMYLLLSQLFKEEQALPPEYRSDKYTMYEKYTELVKIGKKGIS